MIFVCGERDTGNGRSVWAYADDGTLSWTYDTGGTTHEIIADGANNIYVVGVSADNGDGNGTRNVWKLNNAGDYLTGSYILSNANAWSIDIDDDYIYISTGAGAVRTDHSFASSSTIVSGSGALGTIKVDTNGNIYIGVGGVPATLRKYDSSLAFQWQEDTNDSCKSIGILSGGDVIIGTGDGEIRYYKADGTSASAGDWAVVVDGATANIRIAIDSNDNIYGVRYNDTSGSSKRFIHLNTSGVEQGSITTASGDLERVMVTSDGSVYICGDVISGYDVWSVNVTAYTLTGVANATVILIGIVGDGIAGSFFPTDKTYSKKLIAIGNNQIWRESTAGIMSVLSAASDDIDTTANLNAAVAFQKLFIANGTNLKIADFVSTKIVTDDIGAHPPNRGIVLTGGSSGATMIVDYITAIIDDSASTIYGKRTSTATFTAGETVTGTNPSTDPSPYYSGASGAVSFVMTAAAEVAPPHWYNWTVYGTDAANYGAMPTRANQVCNFMGSLMLAGDSNYPHQWYMSRQFNPFDWLYAQDDAQSAVAGNDADAGEIGDIVKVNIPYKDDYVVHACANTLWYMTGHPCAGGTIVELDLTTGILGDRAFCWDDVGNLYMVCTVGLLRIPPGFGQLENLTIELWPDFITDLAFNASLHRITLAFNPEDRGIHIFRTTLSTGASSAWWYDLRTEGLFPDSYSTDHGAFSVFYYQSEDPSYRKLLIGCNDGYIRSWDRTAKNDDSVTINSYVGFAPLSLSTHPRKDGIIKNIDLVSGGGASDGSQSDSNDVLCSVHVARTAEQIIEKLDGDITAAFTKTFTAPGYQKGNMDRRVIRGQWGGIVLSNNAAGESWSMERLIIDVKEAGRSL